MPRIGSDWAAYSQAKRGTNSFFAYATAYLVLQGQRFTLAVTPVMRSECLKEVLQELLLLVSKAGLKPGLLLLDRGFYSVAVIRYLQRARRPGLTHQISQGFGPVQLTGSRFSTPLSGGGC